MATPKGIKSFREFWPYYVQEHLNPTCRRLHFVGTFLTFVFLFLALSLQSWIWLWGMPLVGYGFAWAGHFLFEKNRPATFTYPTWSLIADYKMFFLTLAGRMPAEIENSRSRVRVLRNQG